MRHVPFILPLLLAACAVAPPCPAGLDPAMVVEAVFGRNLGATLVVSDADWDGFLATEVTPRFPDGLTVVDAAGQWRDRAGRIIREPAKLLVLVLPGASGAEAASRLAPVTSAYVQRFGQEAVLTVQRSACIAF